METWRHLGDIWETFFPCLFIKPHHLYCIFTIMVFCVWCPYMVFMQLWMFTYIGFYPFTLLRIMSFSAFLTFYHFAILSSDASFTKYDLIKRKKRKDVMRPVP